eukprot:13768780-Alexandrium_andersonii.AAC.1
MAELEGECAKLDLVIRKFVCPVSALVAEETDCEKGALARAAKVSKLELRLPVVTNAADIEGGTVLR